MLPFLRRDYTNYFIASSAEIYRDLSSNLNQVSLDVRLEEATKLAEKCASFRENLKLDEEFQELDIQATKLWNLSTTLTRDNGNGNGVLSQRNQNIFGGALSFCSSGVVGTDLAKSGFWLSSCLIVLTHPLGSYKTPSDSLG